MLFFSKDESDRTQMFPMKQRTWKKRNAGFTLLEVMVALAIIGIALVAILRSLAMSVSVSNEAKSLSIGTLLAKGKMAEIESRGFPDIEEADGDFGEEYPGYRWERNVSEIGIEDLRKVVVRVLWGEGENAKRVELVTLLAKR